MSMMEGFSKVAGTATAGVDVTARAKVSKQSKSTLEGRKLSSDAPQPVAHKTELQGQAVLVNRPVPAPRPTNFVSNPVITHKERESLVATLKGIDLDEQVPNEISHEQHEQLIGVLKGLEMDSGLSEVETQETQGEQSVEKAFDSKLLGQTNLLLKETFTTEKTTAERSKLALSVLNDAFVSKFPEAKEVVAYLKTMSDISTALQSKLDDLQKELSRPENRNNPEKINDALATFSKDPDLKNYFEHMQNAGMMQLKAASLQNKLNNNSSYKDTVQKTVNDHDQKAVLKSAALSSPDSLIMNTMIMFVQRGPRYVMLGDGLEKLQPKEAEVKEGGEVKVSPFLQTARKMASAMNETTRTYESSQELEKNINQLAANPKLKLVLKDGELTPVARSIIGKRESVGTSKESHDAAERLVSMMKTLKATGADISPLIGQLETNVWFSGVMVHQNDIKQGFDDLSKVTIKVELQSANSPGLQPINAVVTQALGAPTPPKDKGEMFTDAKPEAVDVEPKFASLDKFDSFAHQAEILIKDSINGGAHQAFSDIAEDLGKLLGSKEFNPQKATQILQKLDQGLVHTSNVLEVLGGYPSKAYDLQYIGEARELLTELKANVPPSVVLANTELKVILDKLETTLEIFDQTKTNTDSKLGLNGTAKATVVSSEGESVEETVPKDKEEAVAPEAGPLPREMSGKISGSFETLASQENERAANAAKPAQVPNADVARALAILSDPKIKIEKEELGRILTGLKGEVDKAADSRGDIKYVDGRKTTNLSYILNAFDNNTSVKELLSGDPGLRKEYLKLRLDLGVTYMQTTMQGWSSAISYVRENEAFKQFKEFVSSNGGEAKVAGLEDGLRNLGVLADRTNKRMDGYLKDPLNEHLNQAGQKTKDTEKEVMRKEVEEVDVGAISKAATQVQLFCGAKAGLGDAVKDAARSTFTRVLKSNGFAEENYESFTKLMQDFEEFGSWNETNSPDRQAQIVEYGTKYKEANSAEKASREQLTTDQEVIQGAVLKNVEVKDAYATGNYIRGTFANFQKNVQKNNEGAYTKENLKNKSSLVATNERGFKEGIKVLLSSENPPRVQEYGRVMQDLYQTVLMGKKQKTLEGAVRELSVKKGMSEEYYQVLKEIAPAVGHIQSYSAEFKNLEDIKGQAEANGFVSTDPKSKKTTVLMPGEILGLISKQERMDSLKENPATLGKLAEAKKNENLMGLLSVTKELVDAGNSIGDTKTNDYGDVTKLTAQLGRFNELGNALTGKE